MGRPERLINPEDGPVQRFAVQLRELRQATGRPSYRQLAKRAHYSVTALSEAAGGERLPTLAVTLAYVEACGGDQDEWRARWQAVAEELEANGRHAIGGEDALEEELGEAPYRGLAVFQPEDTDRFFGREGDVTRVVEKLDGGRFLAVLGPSGCGKSSLVRAGVIPALRHGALPRSQDWTIRVLTPTASPLRALAALLTRLLPGESMQHTVNQLWADHRSVDLAVRMAFAGANGDQRLVLVVDQLEEMFTLCTDEAERAAFVANLCGAADDPAGRLVVVVAMRADFYHCCAAYPRLSGLMADRQFLVSPLGTDGLRRVIEQPAWRASLELEGGLVETILDDVADRPGALPLLQYALLEVWRRRRGKVLTVEAYVASGGVERGLAQRADAIYRTFTPVQQRIARQVLLRLIQPGQATEDTRRRAEVSELSRRPDERADLEAVLGVLAGARLLTASVDEATGVPVIEVSHEALIRGWPRLQGWIDQDRELLRAHRRLTEAATEWDEGEREEGFLYGETRLAAWRTRPLEDLNERERAFLAASEARGVRERAAERWRRRKGLLGVAVAVAIISTLVALAMGQRGDARAAFSRQLAGSADAQLPIDPELSLLLARRAFETSPTIEAEAALRQATWNVRENVALRGHDGRVHDAVFSPDGRRLVSAATDGTLRVWDLQQPAEPIVLRGHDGAVQGIAMSPDGRQVASTGEDGTVRLWSLDPNADPVVLGGHDGPAYGVAFRPDGRQLATTGQDGTVRIWDVAGTAAPVTLRGHDGPVYGVAFSADGRRIASTGLDGAVRLWDLVTGGDPVPLEGHDDAVLGVAFSPSGAQLATSGHDGTVRVWDLAGDAGPLVLEGHGGTVWEVAFSPDGRQVASAGEDGTVRVWTPESGADVSIVLRGHVGGVYDVAFSPDGRRLATPGEDGTVRIWTLPVDPPVLSGHEGFVYRVAFSPDGQRLATASQDGTVRVWKAAGAQDPVVLRGHAGQVYDLAFSPSGEQVASTGEDGALRVWNVATASEAVVLHGHEGLANSVAFSPDGRQLASAGEDGTVRLWTLEGNVSQRVLRGHAGPVERVAFSPDGRLLASAGGDGTVRLWDLATGAPPRTLQGHQGPVYEVAFSPDGRQLASGGDDGVVRLWNLATQAAVHLHGHEGIVLGLAFSPDGQRLASAGADHTVRVWRASESNPGILVVLRGHRDWVYHVTFSPDGQQIASASADRTVRLWSCPECGPLDDVLALAERRATRTLTAEERQTFLREPSSP
ncbi:MAG: hypothetical protein ACRDZO_15360 [Egibacteraceae bacterium]